MGNIRSHNKKTRRNKFGIGIKIHHRNLFLAKNPAHVHPIEYIEQQCKLIDVVERVEGRPSGSFEVKQGHFMTLNRMSFYGTTGTFILMWYNFYRRGIIDARWFTANRGVPCWSVRELRCMYSIVKEYLEGLTKIRPHHADKIKQTFLVLIKTPRKLDDTLGLI